MSFLWEQLRGGIELIAHGNPDVIEPLETTVRVALVSTAAALAVGLPLGLGLGVGRFRGRRALQLLANASLALPPVVVGLVVALFIIPEGPLHSLRIEYTITAVYVVQSILALPYIVALTPAAVRGVDAGLLAQARVLGASRVQLATLALREARIGVLAAAIAALGAAVSEVGAIVIVGGNTVGQTETLASSLIANFTRQPDDPHETATGLLLAALVLVLLGAASLLQQSGDGIRLRLRPR